MMDYPYPTNFLAPLPAKPVNYACKLLSGAKDKLQGLAEAAGLAYNGSSAHNTGVECFDIWAEFVECADPTGCGTGNANKAWDYQVSLKYVCYDKPIFVNASSCGKILNPLQACNMEVALISGFCSVKRVRVFDSPWTGH